MDDFIRIGGFVIRKSEISNIELKFEVNGFLPDFGYGIIYIELMNGTRRVVKTSLECRKVVNSFYESVISQLV